MRTLADVGEFGLIERIAKAAGAASGRGAVVLSIGDDAAVLRPPRGQHLLVTTDALVEDVHFRWASESPAHIGHRALAATLSDLAAMGARPLGFVAALAAPRELPLARALGLARGLGAASRAFGCPLVGGNLTAARETQLVLTAFGCARPDRILTRRGARPGDRIFVTGSLGAMALAVARAARGGRVTYLPVPRLGPGQALARIRGIGGVIDVSDGLEADLGHLLAAADGGPLGAALDLARLPVPRGFRAACARLGLDPEALLLGGGEDYELLFTAHPGAPGAAVLARRLGVAVREIGRVTGRQRTRSGALLGWRHF